MIKRILIIALISFMSLQCWANDGYGFLVNIINKSKYDIGIQTTDQAGSIIKKTNLYNQLQNEQIKNKQFMLSEIASFNLYIPQKGWDGPARIYVDIMNGNNLVQRYELLERDNAVELWKLMPKMYDETGMQRVAIQSRSQSTQYTLLVDEANEISFPQKDKNGNLITTTHNSPPQVTFVFNGIDKPISVGSPNCSIETHIDKQYRTIDPHATGAEVTMLMKDDCKIVVTGTDSQGNPQSATACFGFVTKNSQGKWDNTQNKWVDNFHEKGCSDPECTPDPDTGISPCDKLGISWVEGLDPQTGARTRAVGPNHYKVFYGIVKTSQ